VRKFDLKRRLFLGVAFFCFHGIPAAQSNDLALQSQQAKQLMAESRFDEAIPIYKRLVAAVPGNSGLILNLGPAEEMGGHPQEAILHFESVLRFSQIVLTGLRPTKPDENDLEGISGLRRPRRGPRLELTLQLARAARSRTQWRS